MVPSVEPELMDVAVLIVSFPSPALAVGVAVGTGLGVGVGVAVAVNAGRDSSDNACLIAIRISAAPDWLITSSGAWWAASRFLATVVDSDRLVMRSSIPSGGGIPSITRTRSCT